jgi:transposase-like protein
MSKEFELIHTSGEITDFNSVVFETYRCKRCGFELTGKTSSSAGYSNDNWIEPMLSQHIEKHLIVASEKTRENVLNNWN